MSGAATHAVDGLRWPQIVRLGLGQVAIGAVAALMLSTLNRVMVVELQLPATVPSVLVALHFAAQLARARMGFASDRTRHRAPWIVGGAVVLALGATLAAVAVALMATRLWVGLALATVAYLAIGLGLSASGTALLALVAEQVPARRLGAVAAGLWIMMIAGIAVTAGVTGALLDPFTLPRLVAVSSGVGVVALLLSVIAATSPAARADATVAQPASTTRTDAVDFRSAAGEALREPATRRFVGFIFLAMLAFSAQDLILEPFAGQVFGMTPGETTRMAGMQHGGVLLGMLAAAWCSTRIGSLRAWAVGGCLASAVAFLALSVGASVGSVATLQTTVLCLGIANGVFTVGGVGSMMAITSSGDRGQAGLRLGIFGAAQGIAYGTGGLAGGVASDAARWALGTPAAGYGAVFVVEAVLFVGAAWLAARSAPAASPRAARAPERGDAILAVLR
jgi:BCD family chlorophyll transporter-like MFS transporter